MEEEDEVYGGELPEELEGEFEGDVPKEEEADTQELEAIKQRMQENENELAKLRQMQSKLDKELATGGASGSEAEAVNREEADARSIYIGNVDYSTTPEELQQLFQSCGTVNRITILTDKFENPKGFAYLEFLEVDAVQTAVALNGTELHGRPLKISAKRTNVPGMKQGGRGRGRGGRGGRFGMPYGGYGMMPMMMPMMPYGGRGFGRGRGRGGRGRGYTPY
uniref:RRM domain-containing protein n=1 Tax=Pyramimonas obovata TaxID=1411642 RepID=A0A7S0RJ00_9CHLO|mmetsp:Transcript_35271/g.77082  ORF Transcript_35271/g.77082 Transcript_35271/m.77082 type:complete len:222 (+) Transcript_35271:70-735(+)